MSAFRQKQAMTAVGIVLALLLTVAGFALPTLLHGFPLSPERLEERIALWVAAEVFVFLWLLVAVGRLARHRFFSEADIDAGGGVGSPRAAQLQAQLQNTLEQTVLASFAHFAWLTLMPREVGMLALVFVVYFGAGRLLFFAGYARGAAARALGFGLTFYPSVGLFLGGIPFAGSRLAAWACGDGGLSLALPICL